MSTPRDIAEFESWARGSRISPGRALYVGIHESPHIAVMRRIWPKLSVETLDVEAQYRPTIVWDLNCPDQIPGGMYDLVVSASVLMYLDDPVSALDRLIAIVLPGGRLVVQENVVRDRGVEKGYDRHRFYAGRPPFGLKLVQLAGPDDDRKSVHDLSRPELRECKPYWNPLSPSASCIFVFDAPPTPAGSD